jgi:hypothetical protein
VWEDFKMKKIANVMLGAWLILTGLIALTDFNFNASSTILALVAAVAGVLLILADRNVKFPTHIPDFVLGLWLVLMGLFSLLNIHFRGSHALLEVIALIAGVLIIIRR